MSIQRRRGQFIEIDPWEIVTDKRGNKLKVASSGKAIRARAALIPDRFQRAEIPGQLQIDVVTLIVQADLPDVGLWSRVRWDGRYWDVMSPPAIHIGRRHNRHWTLTLKARPDTDGGENG